jgi:hypothetical protein
MRQDKAHARQRSLQYPAEMQQSTPSAAYLPLLGGLDRDVERLAAQVARDVAPGGRPDAGEVDASQRAVRWLLDTLRRGPVPTPEALRPLREDAAARARAGGEVRPVIDRALSAGWVLWSAATTRPDTERPALASLGEALLRTGDAAAAAIADAHAAAQRELAARSASALRELLDQLLELPEGDEPSRAHLGRRLAELGIPVDRPLAVVLADAGRDLQDGDPVVAEVARALARGTVPSVGDPRALGGPVPAPVVAATRGRLVLLLPTGVRPADPLAGLRALGSGWVAATAPATGLLAASGALREAAAALVVAMRLDLRDRLTGAESVLLERALLAEPELLAGAVDRELGPLVHAPRAAGLVETLEAYLAERENIRAAGRRLGVAPRTVAYRLARIERLLGGRLDADRRLRLATVLFARRLSGPPAIRPPEPASTGRAVARPVRNRT